MSDLFVRYAWLGVVGGLVLGRDMCFGSGGRPPMPEKPAPDAEPRDAADGRDAQLLAPPRAPRS